jgi:N-acylneuraminate cytidylyltransferase
MLGRPLIAWSIEHALSSKYIKRVVVSTDDEEIAAVARYWGAETPFIRPMEYSGDLSPDIETFKHALQWFENVEKYRPILVVHLRPTGPARRVSKIDEAIELILNHPDTDSLRSVSLASQNPFKMWLLNEDKRMRPALTLEGVRDAHSLARQMLPRAYWQNGYVDIVRPSTVLVKNSMVGDHVLPFVIDEPVCDVDYIDDIPVVESVLKRILDNPDGNLKDNDIINRFPV